MLGAELFRAGRAPIVVFTGGKPRGDTAPCPIARVMAALAIQLGVPRENVLVEDRSRNTWENATYTSSLLRPRGIHRVLLVTDSVHMRRAQACFRTQGFETGRASVPSRQLHPNNLYLLQETVHEYLGYWYYRLTKRIHGGRS
jgi:uncharacterized SAM-binding protein YcdF (DUF218 family)